VVTYSLVENPKYFSPPYDIPQNYSFWSISSQWTVFQRTTTAKAIITKCDQNIKQIELYTNCRIFGQKERDQAYVINF